MTDLLRILVKEYIYAGLLCDLELIGRVLQLDTDVLGAFCGYRCERHEFDAGPLAIICEAEIRFDRVPLD